VAPVLWRIEEFDEIDSTNRWLVERARDGAAEGLVARADFQSAGRGRLTRTWEAPAHSSLLTSLLLRPPLDEASAHVATVAVALCARDALTRLCGLRPDLKWPNDLIVRDRKIGGILAEAVRSNDGALSIVVGLGLNLTYAGPEGAGGTSVRDEAGVTIDPRAMLDMLLFEMDERVGLISDSGSETLSRQYAAALSTIGRRVRVERMRDEITGTAVGVDERGRLLVEVGADVTPVDVGDVVHLRAETP